MKIKETVELLLTKEQAVELQLRDILKPTKTNPNDTELKVLSYVFFHGREAIIKASLDKVGTTKSIENIITKFRKLGIIHGKRNHTKLHPSIEPFTENFKFVTKVTIINE